MGVHRDIRWSCTVKYDDDDKDDDYDDESDNCEDNIDDARLTVCT